MHSILDKNLNRLLEQVKERNRSQLIRGQNQTKGLSQSASQNQTTGLSQSIVRNMRKETKNLRSQDLHQLDSYHNLKRNLQKNTNIH